MRADVKLGVVISAVVVFVAGGYFLYRDRAETAVPIDDRPLSSATPERRVDAPDSVAPAARRPEPATRTIGDRPGKGKRNAQRNPPEDARRRVPKPPQRGSESERVAEDRPADTPRPSSEEITVPSVRRETKPTGDQDSSSRSEGTVGSTGPPAPVRVSTEGGASEPAVERTAQPDAGASGGLHTEPTRRIGRGGLSATGATSAPSSRKRDPVAVDSPGSSPFPSGSPVPHRKTITEADAKPAPPQAMPTPAADAPSTAADTHRVQPGDTLSSLAQMYYGHVKHTRVLIDGNPDIGDPNRLEVGALIKIPPLPSHAEAASAGEPVLETAPAGQTPRNRRTYTVKPGDTFYGIARDVLGDASQWKELFSLNRELVQGDPRRLQVGQVIVFPES